MPLATVPEGDWYCPACVQQRGKKRPADAPQEAPLPSPPQGQCFVTSGCLLSQPHEGPCIVPHEGGRAKRASRGKGVQRLGINDSWRALTPPAASLPIRPGSAPCAHSRQVRRLGIELDL